MQRLGEKLRTLRKQHGLSLRELATTLEVNSYSHLSEIESGKSKPSVDLLLKMANYFNVMTDQLLRDELEVNDQ